MSKEERFVKQQYGQVGRHSVVKICSWTKKNIRKEGSCYKHYFYGINTLGCVEMSPILICNQRCKHCWRDHSLFAKEMKEFDEPKEIVDGCIKERQRLLMGFKGYDKIDLKVFEKALIPQHAAISLTGEPCLYPKLPELVTEFYSRGFETVFVVTNGTVPEMVKKLGELPKPPTNIYLSLETWNDKSYDEFCHPLEPNQREKIMQTMEIMSKMKNLNTVLRITVVKDFNMDKAKEFSWAVEKMQPKYIECKAYMFVGYSRFRLKDENMPSQEKVQQFASELAEATGYKVIDQQLESWVVLLGK